MKERARFDSQHASKYLPVEQRWEGTVGQRWEGRLGRRQGCGDFLDVFHIDYGYWFIVIRDFATRGESGFTNEI
jgi:hypothetical protein